MSLNAMEHQRINYTPLFEANPLRLTPLDAEKDPQVMAAWTNDLEIAAKLREEQPLRPLPTFEVKRVVEKWQKEAEDNKQYLFALRLKGSDEVIGVVRICYIAWVHGAAYLDLIIGANAHRQQYSMDALNLAMRYAFDELGLFRLTTVIAEHDQETHQLLESACFTLEVRQRQAVFAQARSWDKLFFGMLRPEWKMLQAAQQTAMAQKSVEAA